MKSKARVTEHNHHFQELTYEKRVQALEDVRQINNIDECKILITVTVTKDKL